jgi:hypothetical protein
MGNLNESKRERMKCSSRSLIQLATEGERKEFFFLLVFGKKDFLLVRKKKQDAVSLSEYQP